jgi:type VI secretion system lysozyme-like protein
MTDKKVEVRAPLFDRLVDRDPESRHEIRPMRTLDRRGVRESVRRELETLFNTRCPIPAHRLAARERTVIDYGIPDFSTFSARNFSDHGRLAQVLREAVDAYEPRLTNVRVSITPIAGDDLALSGRIDADLMIENVPEPVSFATTLRFKEGSVNVE